MTFAATLAPKTDQLNADDLLAGDLVITITDVKVNVKDKEGQKAWIYYQGDNGKPWKPCLQMRHVLFRIWGDDEKNFIGKSLRLYRDDKVRFGGEAVGGIRISHMSHITEEMTAIIPVTRGIRKGWKVQPLQVNAPRPEATPEQKAAAARKKADDIIARMAACETVDGVNTVCQDEAGSLSRLDQSYPEEYDRVIAQRDFKLEALSTQQQE